MAGEATEYNRHVSVQLSWVMDDIGANKTTIKRRRQTGLMSEELLRMLVNNKDIQAYLFGSQTEGTTIPGLQSDEDVLFYNGYYNVIHDLSEWIPERLNLLMLQEDTAPGHRRLQVLRSDVALPREDLPSDDFDYDRSGRLLYKNTLKNKMPHDELNGPAISSIGKSGKADSDQIHAMRCKTWPHEAEGWKTSLENQPSDWITPDVLQKAVAEGFFLVPVGYKLSGTPDLEWRVSLSYAERLLMFSMNVIQIKCYILLKMVVKTFITPRTGKTITSYHCKGTLFHCIRATDRTLWLENNLLQCVILCLTRLLTFLRNRHCPHFMMPEINLFDGKITPKNRVKLLEILRTLIQSNNGQFLLSIHNDQLGALLQYRLNYPMGRVSISERSADIVAFCEWSLFSIFIRRQLKLLSKHKDTEPRSCVKVLYQLIQRLHETLEECNVHKRRILEHRIAFLWSWIGSILSATAISNKRPIPSTALQLFQKGTHYSVASMLKLASALYSTGVLKKAEVLLYSIKKRFEQEKIRCACLCYDFPYLFSPVADRKLYTVKSWRKRLNCFVPCVIFTKHDIHCAPQALSHEMNRPLEDGMFQRIPGKDAWMDLAVVDSLPFLYYLQYLTYRQLEKHDLQKKSLESLERCLKTADNLGHIETGWNLLGQCMEQEHKPDEAMKCYETSFGIRPRNNVVKLHIQNLYDRKIRGEI